MWALGRIRSTYGETCGRIVAGKTALSPLSAIIGVLNV